MLTAKHAIGNRSIQSPDATLERVNLPASTPFPKRFLRSACFPAACFLALSAALYGNSLLGTFVYDDAIYVVNRAFQDPASLRTVWFQQLLNARHYRPLTFASFALNFLLTGTSPVWFHLVSIILNGITSWLVFALASRLFGDKALAWSVALLFALFPIHTEAVAYIKARDELFVAFFGVLAWLAFLRATEGGGKGRVPFSALAAALSLCAFLSKESALVLPGVFGGTLLLMRGMRGVRREWLALLLQALAIAAFSALYYRAFGMQPIPGKETMFFGQNPLGFMDANFIPWTAAMLFFVATVKTFVPWNLSATYGYAHLPPIDSLWGSWMAPAGLAMLLLLLTLILHPRTRRTPFGVGALTFLVLYFPFSKIPFIHGMDYFGERWLYAPSIGLAMLGACTWLLLWKRHRRSAIAVGLITAAAYTAIIVQRNTVWSDPLALGESMVRSAPQSVIAYDFLAYERLQEGRPKDAWGLVGKGLAITRMHTPIHLTAATVALNMGNIDLAEQTVAAAESLDPEKLEVALLRATVLASQGKYQESLTHLTSCRSLDMNNDRVHFLFALNLWKLGRREEAMQFFEWGRDRQTGWLSTPQKIELLESF